MSRYKVYLCDLTQRPGERMKRLSQDVTLPDLTAPSDFLEEAWYILEQPFDTSLKVFENIHQVFGDTKMITVGKKDGTPVIEFVRYAK